MPVGLRLIRAASFDPETTHAMGEAYDQACAGVDAGDAAAREHIAKRIIEAARGGERDIAKLVVHALGPAIESARTSQARQLGS